MTATEIVLLSVAAVLLFWEILGMLSQRGLVTWRIELISPVMRHDGRLWLVWPWGLGVLPAHWLWPWSAPEGAWMYLVAATLGLVVLDVGYFQRAEATPKQAPFITFILGIVAGAAFWAMGY